MKMLTNLTLVVTTIAWSSGRAAADHRPPLFELAQRYEAAADQFERIVLSVRGIDRADEKLVDRLDDAAARFRRASQNPRHLNRLYYEWQNVQKWQAQVESRIFGKYTPHHDLVYGWRAVRQQNAVFAEEFFYHVENPDHARNVRRVVQNSIQRNRFFGSPEN